MEIQILIKNTIMWQVNIKVMKKKLSQINKEGNARVE